MSKRSSTRVIVQTISLDDLVASIYDTGLVTVIKDQDPNILFRLANGASIVDDGYLLKLLECFNSLARENDNVVYNPRHPLTLELQEVNSGIALREILDSKYSDSEKFAAVAGLLSLVPQLPSNDVFYIIDRQVKFKDIGLFDLSDLATYFSPDFQVARKSDTHEGMIPQRREAIFLSPDQYRVFQDYSSFLVNSEVGETYDEYFTRVGEEWFVPTELSSECSQACAFVSQTTAATHSIVKNMTSDQMVTFYKNYERFTPVLYEFFEDRVLSGVVPAIKDSQKIDYETLSVTSLSNLGEILTKEELEDLETSFHEGLREELLGYQRLGIMARGVMAYYYIKRGASGVIDLARYIKTTRQSDFWNAYHSYRASDSKMMKISDFISAAGDEYKTYPLDWTMQIVRK